MVVAVVLTFLFVLGILLSGSLMMGGNLGGLSMMMGPWMFAAMLWPSVLVAVIAAAVGVTAYNLLVPKINPTNVK